MKFKKYISLMFILTFVFFANTISVQAADFRVAAKEGGNVNVNQEEEITNLYTAGNIISIDANVEKGLHAVGNIININGNVGHSIYTGASTLVLRGNVGGSVHSGAGNMVIDSNIIDDLVIAGGNVSISDKTSIGGDLIAGAGIIDIQGTVGGNVYLSGGSVTINGEIDGDVKLYQVDEIILGDNALITGNFEYYSEKEINISEGAVILGETIIKEKSKIDKFDKGILAGLIFTIISITLFVKLVGMIITGLLFAYLFKNFTQLTIKDGITNFWKNLGVGFVILVVTPVAIIILMATIFGIMLGMLVGMIYMISLTLAGVMAGLILGSWLRQIISKEKDYFVDWKVVIGGLVVLMLLKLVPIIGWFAIFILFLITLGAIYRTIFKIYRG